MTAIIIRFCGFNSIAGTVIPWFTQSDDFVVGGKKLSIGHAEAEMSDGSLLGAQFENLGGAAGVAIRPKDYGASCGMTDMCRVAMPSTHDQPERFWGFLQDQVGKPYDLTAIGAFVAGRDWHDQNAWFCSELMAAALEYAGAVRPLAAPCNKVSPGALLLACSAIAPVSLVEPMPV